MKTYAEVRADDSPRSGKSENDSADELLPCRFCGIATKRNILTALGARCEGCWRKYQSIGYSGSQRTPQLRQADWIRKAARRAAEIGGSRQIEGHVGSAVAGRAASLSAKHAVPRGLSDDEVNELIAGMSR